MIEVKNVTQSYEKGKKIINNINFKVEDGCVFGFIGPNGAGKSTTIRSIMNLINRTEGDILLNGKKLDKDDIKAKELIGYLPSEIHLYDDFTVKEMLDYHESFYKNDCHKRRKELVEKLKLDETKMVEELSLGNSKKLGIVLAFMHEPKLLILDEPTSGLDPIMQQVFYELLREERKKGTTIFYSTHILSEISKICDRIGIIKEGQLVAIETIEEMQKKNLTFVTIKSKDISKIIADLKLEIKANEENTIRFKNDIPLNQLIKVISNYKIDKLLMEEATLEDIFLHYYN